MLHCHQELPKGQNSPCSENKDIPVGQNLGKRGDGPRAGASVTAGGWVGTRGRARLDGTWGTLWLISGTVHSRAVTTPTLRSWTLVPRLKQCLWDPVLLMRFSVAFPSHVPPSSPVTQFPPAANSQPRMGSSWEKKKELGGRKQGREGTEKPRGPGRGVTGPPEQLGTCDESFPGGLPWVHE